MFLFLFIVVVIAFFLFYKVMSNKEYRNTPRGETEGAVLGFIWLMGGAALVGLVLGTLLFSSC